MVSNKKLKTSDQAQDQSQWLKFMTKVRNQMMKQYLQPYLLNQKIILKEREEDNIDFSTTIKEADATTNCANEYSDT